MHIALKIYSLEKLCRVVAGIDTFLIDFRQPEAVEDIINSSSADRRWYPDYVQTIYKSI